MRWHERQQVMLRGMQHERDARMRQRSNDEFDDLPSPMTMVTIMGGTWVLTVFTQGLARGQ